MSDRLIRKRSRQWARRLARLSASQPLERLEGGTDGLSSTEAAARIASLGPNLLPKSKGRNRLQIFLSQFNSPLIFLLLFAASASMILRELADAAFVISVLLVNAVVGGLQEARGETQNPAGGARDCDYVATGNDDY